MSEGPAASDSQRSPAKVLPATLTQMKLEGRRIVMVTAYDAVGGQAADEAGVDVLLVGDTAAEVVWGHRSTVPATMDEQLMMTRAVVRGARRPLIVGDLPFGAYEVSNEQAVENAIRLRKEGGADVVKLEGAGPRLPRVCAIVDAGIGVMGHLGLTPQSETVLGGRRVQAGTAHAARKLLADARELEAAGCFAIVLEAVPAAVAAKATESLTIPTIGIGAGPACDGQVLVWHDLLGLGDWSPRFAHRYAELRRDVLRALTRFGEDVRSGAFPAPEHTYGMPETEQQEFLHALKLDAGEIDR